MKPIIQWVRLRPGIKLNYHTGYWACRWRRGYSYKSGVGETPREAYEMWEQINGGGYDSYP